MTTTKEPNGLPKEVAMAEKIGSKAEIKVKLIIFLPLVIAIVLILGVIDYQNI